MQDEVLQLCVAIALACGSFLVSTIVSATELGPVEDVQHKTFGRYLRLTGWKLNETTATTSLVTSSECICRTACWSYGKCTAVSATPINGGFQCLLSDLGPFDIQPYQDSTSVYTFWQTNKIRLVGHESDGFYYAMPKFYKNFTDARELCEKLPGFRLSIGNSPESLQGIHNSAKALNSWVRVDLEVINSILQWGDGTKGVNTARTSVQLYFNPSSSSTTYLMSAAGTLVAHPMNISYATLCQAKSQGGVWQ